MQFVQSKYEKKSARKRTWQYSTEVPKYLDNLIAVSSVNPIASILSRLLFALAFSQSCIKMRWFMVTKVHENYNSIKPAENRHIL